MLPVMTPVALCSPICTDVMTGDLFKNPRRTKANRAQANGDCPDGVVCDEPMTGPRTALKNPVTILLMMASGPDVGSAAGSASFFVVVVDNATGAVDWAAGDPGEVATEVVMALVLLSSGAEGVGTAVRRRAASAAAEERAVIGPEVAVIADRRDVAGSVLPVTGEADEVTGSPAGAGFGSESAGSCRLVTDAATPVPDDGEPVVADLGCVFRVEAVMGRFGPLRWVVLVADGAGSAVEEADVLSEDVADDESSAAEMPYPVATAATSHADTAAPPYPPTRAVVLVMRDICCDRVVLPSVCV